MNRAFLIGLTLLVALMIGGCAGQTKLTDGAAAGAGIGALLGLGNSGEQGDGSPRRPSEEASGEEGTTREAP